MNMLFIGAAELIELIDWFLWNNMCIGNGKE